jgi:hypothetical protein
MPLPRPETLRRTLLAVALLVAAGPGVLGGTVGCASLAGLSGGGADASVDGDAQPDGNAAAGEASLDTGADATLPRDAGLDSTVPHDATADGPVDAADAQPQDTGAVGIDCASSDATICDDFARSVVLPPGDPRWTKITCNYDGGATMGVDGSLNVGVPSSSGKQCYLQSFTTANLAPPHDLASVGSFRIDVDLTFDTTVSIDSAVVLCVIIDGQGDAGAEQELVQLLVAGDGSGALLLLFSRDNYAPHSLGKLEPPSVWLARQSRCHITLQVDTVTPSATATSTCPNFGPQSLGSPDPNLPEGFAGPAFVELGYQNNTTGVVPAWSLAYGNLEFRASP